MANIETSRKAEICFFIFGTTPDEIIVSMTPKFIASSVPNEVIDAGQYLEEEVRVHLQFERYQIVT